MKNMEVVLSEKWLSEFESELLSEVPVTPSKWQKLEEELICFSCGELFSQPKTIPCLHTFCTKCIQVSTDKKTNGFCCTVCKASFTEAQLKSCRINVSLEYLVGVVKKRNSFVKAGATSEVVNMESSVVISCSQCIEGARATMWCLACEDGETCDECYKSHCRLKIFQSHKVLRLKDFIKSPDQVLNYCPFQEHCRYHRNQPLSFYCHQCLKFVCQHCQCVSDDFASFSWHTCDSIDEVYETEKANLKELQAALQSVMPAFKIALNNNKTADQELDKCMAKEVAWVKEQFQVIRKEVDNCEESILQNLKTIRSIGKSSLETQKTNIIQLLSQLTSCDNFIAGVLKPCRSGEMLAYCEWIKKLAEKITKPHVLDPAYDVNDLSITHGDIAEFTSKLGLVTVHQAFHQPHLPNCTAQLASKCIVPVVLKVVMKDKYNLPVPNQLSQLEIWPKNSNLNFFTNLQKWHDEKGIYCFSYIPKVKEPHEIFITWKNKPLIAQSIKVTGTLDYCAMHNRFHYLERYNKRNLKKPQFLSLTSDGFETIVSDPADNTLIFFAGYYRYQYVITNGNNAFHPCGCAVGRNGYLYVADAFYNCILKFRHSFSNRYSDSYFARFGTAGNESGQFNCPQGLVISKSNLIFICDKNNHRIQVYSITKNGEYEEFSFCIGNFGQEPGYFNHPTDLTLNRVEDKLFVADTNNHRVQVFTPSGQFVIAFPHYYQGYCTTLFAMSYPIGICYGIDGRILVSCKHRVFVFEEDGTQVATINFHSKDPAGIIMHETGYITIALTHCGQIA